MSRSYGEVRALPRSHCACWAALTRSCTSQAVRSQHQYARAVPPPTTHPHSHTQLVLVVGDLHIPSRATAIHDKFRRILVRVARAPGGWKCAAVTAITPRAALRCLAVTAASNLGSHARSRRRPAKSRTCCASGMLPASSCRCCGASRPRCTPCGATATAMVRCGCCCGGGAPGLRCRALRDRPSTPATARAPPPLAQMRQRCPSFG